MRRGRDEHEIDQARGYGCLVALRHLVAFAQDKAKPAAPVAPAAPAAPAAAAPMGPPKPSPELDAAYKGMEGSWKCDTTFAANAMGPGSPELKAKTTVKFKKELGRF